MSKHEKKSDPKDIQEFYDKLMADDDHYEVKSQLHGWAGNFHRYRIKLLRNIFLNDLNTTKNTKILDIGCGPCIFSEIFSKDEYPKVTGFDISTINIKKAQKNNPHFNFTVDNAQNPKIRGEWDVIFAGEIIEHLPQPIKALEKWSKLLKSDGYIILSTPNGIFNKKTEEHISLFKLNEMKKVLNENYQIIKVLGIDLYIPLLNLLLNRFIMNKFPKISDRLFQFKMKLPLKSPILANNIIYIAKKK
ncbi:MAG: class I SAM-dependent methyltransferase [Methanobacteriaceae archaeon]|nr:class I SAM-dependent methyltransferase [Methanobacteriaceae archaeon]